MSATASDASSQPAETKFETITKNFGLVVGGFADAASNTRFVKLADQPWVGTATKDAIEQLVPKDVRDTRLTRIKADTVKGSPHKGNLYVAWTRFNVSSSPRYQKTTLPGRSIHFGVRRVNA